VNSAHAPCPVARDTRDDKPIADGVILTEYQRRARKLTTYYYIDYLGLVNSVRYRLLEVPKRLEKLAKQRSDVAKYKCPDCESVFNALEHINDLMDLAAGDLLCLHCKTPVKELRNENAINENSVSRFHQQMHDIQKLLEQVPANIPARILTPARPADPDDPTAQGRAASRQVALSADNAGAGLRKGNRPLGMQRNARIAWPGLPGCKRGG
jgi:chaperonin cofactor prefoldin